MFAFIQREWEKEGKGDFINLYSKCQVKFCLLINPLTSEKDKTTQVSAFT